MKLPAHALYTRVSRHLVRSSIMIFAGVVHLYTEPVKVPLVAVLLVLLWFLRKRSQGAI
jgi:hypothetical protein